MSNILCVEAASCAAIHWCKPKASLVNTLAIAQLYLDPSHINVFMFGGVTKNLFVYNICTEINDFFNEMVTS